MKVRAGNLAGFGEIGVFRQEPIARVDGLGAGALRRGHELFDVEVAPGGLGLAKEHGFVRLQDMQAEGVGLGIHGNRENPHFLAGPDDPEGNFAPVGNQHFFKHVRFTVSHHRDTEDTEKSFCLPRSSTGTNKRVLPENSSW